jgi:hypothetical protein
MKILYHRPDPLFSREFEKKRLQSIVGALGLFP